MHEKYQKRAPRTRPLISEMRRYIAVGATALYAGVSRIGTAPNEPSIPVDGKGKPVPLRLIRRDLISQQGSEYRVMRLRFATPNPDAPLGVAAPETHMKVRKQA